MNTACVSESERASRSSLVKSVASEPATIFSEHEVHSPYVHVDMSDANCNLLGAQFFQDEALTLVNQLRAQDQVCGGQTMLASKPLTWNAKLQIAAYEHSAQMAATNLVSHVSLDGRRLHDRVAITGYQHILLGENVAAGKIDVRTAIQRWFNSPPHCQQMLTSEFTEIAIACVAKDNSFYKRYWTMNLGRPLSLPKPIQ